jgi:transposase-like protein
MTKTEGKTASATVKAILLSRPDGLREVIRAVMQEVLEAEMDEAVGASKGERTPERLGYRSGYYGRSRPSTSAWTRASRRLPSGRFRSPSPTSSSTPATKRCARPASS